MRLTVQVAAQSLLQLHCIHTIGVQLQLRIDGTALYNRALLSKQLHVATTPTDATKLAM